ncbi:MAG: T9SS type A sorting domain-containing protein [candidate division Zixibacteria bacterium]|nr:T9SS type A sorting domain-containing protein [candidate division Zixibacteria bacterium]
MKRFNILVIVVAVLMAPSLIFAASAHKFMAGKAISEDANTIVVPLNITNEDNLTGIDIPIKFSDGVTLKDVTFENTRTEYFDLKISNIKNDKNTVVIGLIPQMTPTHKPDLAAGTGPIANLVFEVNDVTVEEVTLEAVELKKPNHTLCFIYHDFIDGVTHIRTENPEFETVSVSLLDATPDSPNKPGSFSLSQNYPNPYNPSTVISYDVPTASHVTLSVFNVLGQEVATLVDMDKEAGSHEVVFDGSNLSSGIYFYRIQADNFSKTKKMVLVK